MGLKHKSHIFCFWEFRAEWFLGEIIKVSQETLIEPWNWQQNYLKPIWKMTAPACLQLPLLSLTPRQDLCLVLAMARYIHLAVHTEGVQVGRTLRFHFTCSHKAMVRNLGAYSLYYSTYSFFRPKWATVLCPVTPPLFSPPVPSPLFYCSFYPH